MSDASVSVIDGRAVVRVGGSELLAPIAARAALAEARAAASAAAAAADASDADQSAALSQTAALTAPNVYATEAAGRAAVTDGKTFWTDLGDAGLGLYRRTSSTVSALVSKIITGAMLASSSGSALIGHSMAAVGSIVRPVQAVLRDMALNPRDFGAIGDGFYHPLSERYATLAAAQAVYPFVTSLNQSLDWAGIQAAVNETARDVNRRGTTQLPLGYFILSDSVAIPSNVTFRGISRFGSVINNQNRPLLAPIFVNADPAALINTTIENLAVLGGTHVLKISATNESAGLRLRDISAFLQTIASIEANILQTTKIITSDFDGGGGAVNGLLVTGAICNDVSVIDTRFTNHVGAKIKLAGFNGFTMIGGSCEGGGDDTTGTNTLDLQGVDVSQYGAAAVFRSVYFERTQQRLLRSRYTRAVSFDGCTFMGQLVGGQFKAYTFDTDTDVISFGANHWYMPTVGPKNMSVSGANDNLMGQASNASAGVGGRYGTVAPAPRSLAGGPSFDLLVFSRPSGAPNDGTNQQGVVGTLRIQLKASDTVNGVARSASRIYHVSVDAYAAGNISVAAVQSTAIDNLGPMTFTVQAKAGATPNEARLQAVIANGSTTEGSIIGWSFDWSGISTLNSNQIRVAAP